MPTKRISRVRGRVEVMDLVVVSDGEREVFRSGVLGSRDRGGCSLEGSRTGSPL